MSEFIRAEPISISVVRKSSVINEELGDEKMSVFGSDMQRRVPKGLCLLIDVLAFTQQDPDSIQVPVFARPPDVLERFLAVVALAQVECQLVLGGSHLS